MRFCFILEEKYVHKPMPMVVADQLRQWGHQIDVLQPYAAITSLTNLFLTSYDAYVLKTVSEGPGLTILEAASAGRFGPLPLAMTSDCKGRRPGPAPANPYTAGCNWE